MDHGAFGPNFIDLAGPVSHGYSRGCSSPYSPLACSKLRGCFRAVTLGEDRVEAGEDLRRGAVWCLMNDLIISGYISRQPKPSGREGFAARLNHFIPVIKMCLLSETCFIILHEWRVIVPSAL